MVVERIGGIRVVDQQEIIPILPDLGARRVAVRCVAVEPDNSGEARQDVGVRELVHVLERTRVTNLVVICLVAVRRHALDIGEKVRLFPRAEGAGVVVAVDQDGVEGAVGDAGVDDGIGFQLG